MLDMFKQCKRAATRVVVLLLRSVAGTSLAQGNFRGFSAATTNMKPAGFYSFSMGPRYGECSCEAIFNYGRKESQPNVLC